MNGSIEEGMTTTKSMARAASCSDENSGHTRVLILSLIGEKEVDDSCDDSDSNC